MLEDLRDVSETTASTFPPTDMAPVGRYLEDSVPFVREPLSHVSRKGI